MGTVGQYLGQKGPVINQHDVSDEYRERYQDTFGKSPRERWLEEGRPDESFEEWRTRTASVCRERTCIYDGDKSCYHPKHEHPWQKDKR